MLGKTAPIAVGGAWDGIRGRASIFGRKPPLAKALEPLFGFLLTSRKKFVNSSSTLYVVV